MTIPQAFLAPLFISKMKSFIVHAPRWIILKREREGHGMGVFERDRVCACVCVCLS